MDWEKLALLLSFLAFGGAVILGKLLDDRSETEHGYRFLTKRSFALVALATMLVGIGEFARRKTGVSPSREELFGIVTFFVVGLLVAGALIFYNLRETGPVYGAIGTLFQTVLFVPATPIVLWLLSMWAVLRFLLWVISLGGFMPQQTMIGRR